jgi:hypothetical protein
MLSFYGCNHVGGNCSTIYLCRRSLSLQPEVQRRLSAGNAVYLEWPPGFPRMNAQPLLTRKGPVKGVHERCCCTLPSACLEADVHGTPVYSAAQPGRYPLRKKDKPLKKQFANEIGLEEQQSGLVLSSSRALISFERRCLFLCHLMCGSSQYAPLLYGPESCCVRRLENPPEAGILPEAAVQSLDSGYANSNEERRASASAACTSGNAVTCSTSSSVLLYPPAERSKIRNSWRHLMRWSRAWRTDKDNDGSVLDCVEKVEYFPMISSLVTRDLCLQVHIFSFMLIDA